MLGCDYGLTDDHRDPILGDNFRRRCDWLSVRFNSYHNRRHPRIVWEREDEPRNGRLFPGRIETIADPRFGVKISWRRCFGFDLLTQLTDKNPQILRLFGTVRSPHRAQKNPMRDYFFRTSRQINQKLKFLGSKVDLAPADADRVCVKIDVEVSSIDDTAALFLFGRWRSP